MKKIVIDVQKPKEVMQEIETEGKITKSIIEDALQDAIEKAYRKHSNLSDVTVRVDASNINEIKAYHLYTVVEKIEDYDLEMLLDEAREIDPNAEIGSTVGTPIDISEFGRSAISFAKIAVRSKIREEEKKAVYDKYIDLLHEMVQGEIKSVEANNIIVNLGEAHALMDRYSQMPNENYVEGQKIRVIITECNKELKGPQLKVSRTDSLLVRRLFEKEIPEVYQGLVEIKAIARDPGFCSKVAVYSRNSDIDARGACIGPRGSRVQSIMQELKGESIEIFEWNDDFLSLIKNIFKPAEIAHVFYNDDQSKLIIAVADDQLSITIGKKGKNAKLAYKLLGTKIDIKPMSDIIAAGINISEKEQEFNQIIENKKQEKALRAAEELRKKLEREKALVVEELEIKDVVEKVEEIVPVVIDETETKVDEVVNEVTEEITPVVTKKRVAKTETIIDDETEEKLKEIKKQRTLTPKAEYVSRLENIASNTNSVKQPEKPVRKKKKGDEEERRLTPKALKELKKKEYDIKPVYSDEELEEIENQIDDRFDYDDVDYDEFDKFYDEMD